MYVCMYVLLSVQTVNVY